MKPTIFGWMLLLVAATDAVADEAPLTATLSAAQAQARQFGIFFGGTATQYDLCVKKGFLGKSAQSAEEMAKSILAKMRDSGKDSDQSAYVEDGWNMMRKEVSEHESYYTQERCAAVGKEWTKMMATVQQK
jgi:hypothetical protein